MVTRELVDRLTAEVLDAALDDYVSLPRMAAFAEEILGSGGSRARELVVATAAALVDHPDVKFVDGPMEHELGGEFELRRHLDVSWTDHGSRPDYLVAWLVPRDFDVTESPLRPPEADSSSKT